MTIGNKPRKHLVQYYDYGRIDHLPKCKKKILICMKCWNEESKKRLGHHHEFINPKSIDEINDRVEIIDVIVHCHFAFHKGTIVPALDSARNVRCEIGRRIEVLSIYCKERWTIRDKAPKPNWVMEELEG